MGGEGRERAEEGDRRRGGRRRGGGESYFDVLVLTGKANNKLPVTQRKHKSRCDTNQLLLRT